MPVVADSEFRRIFELPRLSEELDDEAVRLLADHLWTKFGREERVALRPIQARAIYSAADVGGGFYPIGVGAGKFLISVLIPTVRPDTANPLLFVPAHLKQQTLDEIKKWSRYFRIRADLRVESYSALSRVRGADMLRRYQPGMIIGDEIHKFKARNAARTKRLRNYLRENPETEFYALSGTMTQKSVLDYHHLMMWALPQDPPLPRSYHSARNWGRAIDQDVPTGRIKGGALWRLCTDDERKQRTLENLRAGYRRRMVQTAGVVATREQALGTSLEIREITLDMPESIKDDFEHLRETWETPGGDEIDSPTAMYRHSRELAVGFYYKWDPPPPKEWLFARKAWNRFVRETLSRNLPGLESPLQVARACAEGELDEYHYRAWTAVRDSYDYESVPVWRDRFAVDFAEEWALKNNGIVWVSHRAIGDAFERIPYFGGGKAGDKIRKHSGPCAASIPAHGTGKNLTQWSRALVLSPPSGGGVWEQLIGRLHRPGQDADEVVFDVVLNSAETFDGFDRAREQARYIEQTTPQIQKLSYGTVTVSEGTRQRAKERREPQWSR